MSRDEFLDRLARLLPSQFEELVFRLAVPTEYLSPSTAPLATRAIDLLRYLENAGRMEELASYLHSKTRPGVSAAPTSGGAAASPPGAAARTRIFVSYVQQDAPWLKRLQVHLKPLEDRGLCELWDDTRIQPGMVRRDEIEKALQRARAAVLLVSADFLASDAVRKNELLPLLNRVAGDGVRILPLIVRPCLFEHSGLEKYEPANPHGRPLSSMDQNEAETVLVELARFLMGYVAKPGS
ncbi:MAG TPA: toll/interleukin-1 receptor domain-containing protein [Polyangia bacterium]|jgi:hypothetical protein|nr:toll/interleukin-1 receptor domain-containing protein [Polyangia bacterium]